MFQEEKERGKGIARLSPAERNALVARLMFGKDWQRARSALTMLMEAWGLGEPFQPDEGSPDDEAVEAEYWRG